MTRPPKVGASAGLREIRPVVVVVGVGVEVHRVDAPSLGSRSRHRRGSPGSSAGPSWSGPSAGRGPDRGHSPLTVRPRREGPPPPPSPLPQPFRRLRRRWEAGPVQSASPAPAPPRIRGHRTSTVSPPRASGPRDGRVAPARPGSGPRKARARRRTGPFRAGGRAAAPGRAVSPPPLRALDGSLAPAQ